MIRTVSIVTNIQPPALNIKMDPLDCRGDRELNEEACPFYTGVTVTARWTRDDGATSGDITATWSRTPITTTPSIILQGIGYDKLQQDGTLADGNCFFKSGKDIYLRSARFSSNWIRDANKQRLYILGGAQTDLLLLPPTFYETDTTSSERIPRLKFGPSMAGLIGPSRWYGYVDSSTFTDSQWRDMRRTYTASTTIGTAPDRVFVADFTWEIY